MKNTFPKKAKRIPWWFSLQFAILSPQSNASESHDEIVKKLMRVSAKIQPMNEKTLVEGSPLIPAGVETNL